MRNSSFSMHCEYTWSLDHSCTNKNSAQNGQTFSSSLVFTSIWIVSSSTYTFVHILVSGHTANTIDIASSIASNNKVTLHFETSEIARRCHHGSPPHNCQASRVKTCGHQIVATYGRTSPSSLAWLYAIVHHQTL